MSLESLCERDEIVVFTTTTAQDDMMSNVDSKSSKRRKLKCRMTQVARDAENNHDMPMMSEVYNAMFAGDPKITINDTVVYDNKVFSVEAAGNSAEQSWLWTVQLAHKPGLQIDV